MAYNAYNPNIKASVYATDFLETRARILRAKLTRGTPAQRNSAGIAGELAALDKELTHRLNPAAVSSYPRKTATKTPTIETGGTPARRLLRDLAPPTADELLDVARGAWQPYARPVVPTAGAYSKDVTNATLAYNPKLHAEYR